MWHGHSCLCSAARRIGASMSGEPLRVVIVDDEPLARDSIRTLLAHDADVRVMGEGSGSDAAALIARTRPDILFLDIQMPEADGFAVIQHIWADTVPVVLFV